MKVVYKYGTGHPIPIEAKYLCTQIETTFINEANPRDEAGVYKSVTKRENTLVWHYYEISIPEETK